MHYGLVPCHNRGIVAINELPDLAERIQVALLNVMEERDVQVRLPRPPRGVAGRARSRGGAASRVEPRGSEPSRIRVWSGRVFP
jgi:hypothetical protein